MTALHIQCKDSEGNISERTISEIEVEGIDAVIAFCHLRQERRTFNLKRILSAIDISTGELIEDIYAHFDISKAQTKSPIMPSLPVKPVILSGEQLRRLRNKEKYELWGRFGPAVIADLYKKTF